MNNIKMVDLHGQYLRIKEDVDAAIQNVINQTSFINGSDVKEFESALADYHAIPFVKACGNGTDALQIALMSLGLHRGDEVILPAFTYFATVEVVLLLGLKPVFVDVDKDTFNIDVNQMEEAITDNTKVIIPVHLYGQSADMEAILNIAKKHKIFIIEDNAQSIGGHVKFSDGGVYKTGTIGDIGCTSFFPSKNLGAYGDGGALMTPNHDLFIKISKIANHGQVQKYHHEVVGMNSRLDSIQAAILNVKLQYLDDYNESRIKVAHQYNEGFKNQSKIKVPFVKDDIYHVYHQYTVQLANGIDRDKVKEALATLGIPSMVYYPVSCHQQKALTDQYPLQPDLPVSERLSNQVLSLPIHTEMTAEMVQYIIEQVICVLSKF
ncbi:MAG TPA: DegT/DnrJ/EryC1/StrS family aminotransferase [Edaphocola sp.]|nr:DegT/DnrJ/EryC1/StrS family aminotransferase [Edaphocola sp.]